MTPLRLIAVIALGLISACLIWTSFQLDSSVREQIVAAQGKGWKKTDEAKIVNAVSKYGDWPQLMIIGAIGILMAWRFRRSDWTRVIAAAMIASTLAGIVANTSRLTTGRTRPRESPKIEQGWYGPFHKGEILIGNSKYNAFPSGHTATAVGFAGAFLFAKPLFGAVLMLVAFAIAWSRMALGAHHLSDVVVSTILALVVAWFTLRWVRDHGDSALAWIRLKIRKFRNR